MAEITATTTVDFGGIDALIARATRIPAIIAKYAKLIAESARGYAPVDTGALQASIAVELEEWAATIHAGEGLPDGRALFMEEGFHHWLSGAFIQRPFLRPATLEHAAGFIAEIAAAMGG